MMRRFLLSLSLISLCLFSTPAVAGAAFDPFGGVKCGDAQNSKSAICNSRSESTDPIAGTNGVIIKVTNIIAYIAGIAAVIILVVSGIQFITSGGDSAKVATARKTIIGALVGIAVIVLAHTLIVYIVKRI